MRRGRALLRELEEQGSVVRSGTTTVSTAEAGQVSMEHLAEGEVLDRLRRTTVETLTPLEAMNLLYELKLKL